MKRAIVAIVLACAFVASAAAGEPERKLTYREADALLGALVELDGPREQTQLGPDGRLIVVKRGSYDLDIKTRLTIAVNRKRAEGAGAIYAVGYNALQSHWAARHVDGFPDLEKATGVVPPERLSAFQLEVAKGLDALADGAFAPIAWDDLKPKTNAYPVSVLTGLLPILKGLPEDLAGLLPKHD